MSLPWKLSMAAWAGFIAMAAATQAQAMSIQELFSDSIPRPARSAALVLSLKTEAFRNAQAGLIAKADCIEEKLLAGQDPSGYGAMLDRMLWAKNKADGAEGYVLGATKAYCSSSSGAPGSASSGHEQFGATPVQDFYKIVPDNVDKTIVLSFALSTQAARVRLAGDATRGQCIEGLQVKFIDGRPVSVPDEFRQDIMKKLATANVSASTTDSVESILIDAIIKNCGHESI